MCPNTDQKRLRIWTFFAQWKTLKIELEILYETVPESWQGHLYANNELRKRNNLKGPLSVLRVKLLEKPFWKAVKDSKYGKSIHIEHFEIYALRNYENRHWLNLRSY